MLKGKRLNIRIIEKKDLESLRLLRNDSKTSYFLTSVIPISQPVQEQWLKKISTDDSRMYFVIKSIKNVFLGLVRCDEWDKINRSIRIGIDIVPKSRRKGYATEAYNLLLDYLFKDLGLNRVWLLVVGFNKPAIALYKKLNFKLEGKQRKAILRNGKFNDYLMMSMLKKEYEKRK
ncbi:GNAT family N-acetyltransferase [Patescibacteria group bacterium]